MNKVISISNHENEYFLKFINFWFAIHLQDPKINPDEISVKDFEDAITNKFSSKIKCIIDENQIIGISCKWKDIPLNLQKENIPKEIINQIKELANSQPNESIEFYWEQEDGIFGEVIKSIEKISEIQKELSDFIKDNKKLIGITYYPEHFKVLNLTNETELSLSWLRASFLHLEPSSITNPSQVIQSSSVMTMIPWIEKLFKFFDITLKKFPPSALIALAHWATYNGTKKPTIVFDNLDLAQFIIAAITRINELDIVINTKELKETFILILLSKYINSISKYLHNDINIRIANKIPHNSPIIGGKSAVLDFLQYYESKFFKSRNIFIFDTGLNKILDIGNKDNFIHSSRVWHHLNFLRSALRIECLSDQSKWNLCLYDQENTPKNFSYSDYSTLSKYIVNRSNERLDFNLALSNAFRNSVRHTLCSEYFIDTDYFAYMFSGFVDLTTFLKLKGKPCLERETLLSGTFASMGRLTEFVNVTRGQVLKTNDSIKTICYEVNPGDITESGLITNPKKVLVNLDEKKNSKYKIQKGDILIGVKGLVGTVGFIDHEVDNWYAGQAIAILRLKDSTELNNTYRKFISPEYLFLHLKNRNTQYALIHSCMTGKSKSLDMEELRKIPISMPELSISSYQEQCKKLFDAWRKFQAIKGAIDHLSVLDTLLGYLALTTPEFINSHPEVGDSFRVNFYKPIDDLLKKI